MYFLEKNILFFSFLPIICINYYDAGALIIFLSVYGSKIIIELILTELNLSKLRIY